MIPSLSSLSPDAITADWGSSRGPATFRKPAGEHGYLKLGVRVCDLATKERLTAACGLE